jgi:hydrogenase-1 operon protein HyaF
MPLDTIPIVVVHGDVPPDPNAGLTRDALSGNAPAVLREIAEHTRRLLADGVPAAIDLHAMPLTPADLDWLSERLGAGEITVTLDANGESNLRETACAGVWWVTHRNEQGAVVSEFVEITFVPELVKAHHKDVAIGLEHLEMLLFDLS